MALYNFHRVLIAVAILFFYGFSLYSFRGYMDNAHNLSLAMAVVSGIVCVGTVTYLAHFNSAIRSLQAHLSRPQDPSSPTG